MYFDYLKNYSVPSPWGKPYKAGIMHRRLILDSDEIETQRNLLFKEVLTQIANGISLSNVAGLKKIIEEVKKVKPSVSYELKADAKGAETLNRLEFVGFIESKSRGEFLYILACHSLVAFLSVKGNPRRIKRCPYCCLVFIAKDAKRKICYDNPACKNKYHSNDMKSRRAKDPVRYLPR
jgi:hypothetical protein